MKTFLSYTFFFCLVLIVSTCINCSLISRDKFHLVSDNKSNLASGDVIWENEEIIVRKNIDDDGAFGSTHWISMESKKIEHCYYRFDYSIGAGDIYYLDKDTIYVYEIKPDNLSDERFYSFIDGGNAISIVEDSICTIPEGLYGGVYLVEKCKAIKESNNAEDKKRIMYEKGEGIIYLPFPGDGLISKYSLIELSVKFEKNIIEDNFTKVL